MISQRARGLRTALLIGQSVFVVLALLAAMTIAFTFFTGAATEHLERYPIYAALLILGLWIDSARRDAHKAANALFQRDFLSVHATSLRQTFFAAGALLLYLAIAKDAFISRTVLAIEFPLLYLVLLWSNRDLPAVLARHLFSRVRAERILLIGPASDARRLLDWIKVKEAFGVGLVGLVNDDIANVPTPGLPRLGRSSELERVLNEHPITQAIFLELPNSVESHEGLVHVLENHGVRVLILSNLEAKLGHRAVHIEDDGLSFITSREEPLENPIHRLSKRLLDLAIALPIVLFLLPPAGLLVWILQCLQSRGPLLFRQVRAGIQNRPFQIIKFRTMHAGHTEPTRQATLADARIFAAGRWLRRLSIDELPQFWNVVTGDMSVVGPRPHLIEHNTDFARQMSGYHLRTFVKPGITGLAQVRGFRGEVYTADDIRHRLESDISYFENWRLALDLAIIFRTALQIFLFSGNRLLGSRGELVARPHFPPDTTPAPAPGTTSRRPSANRQYRQILGIRFFIGSAADAVEIGMRGGLVVAPAAPALLELETDPVHRAAITGSALAITDSGLMVTLWKMMTGESITRVSGLEYLKLLIARPELRAAGATFWIMPHAASRDRNLAWLQAQGIPVTAEDCYLAPQYRKDAAIEDPALIEAVLQARPAHIIMAIGGGMQERVGAYLLRNLDYRPAVHCLGAAIGFLSGDQVAIPMWADRLRLGWLLRCLDEPRKFVPRYWDSRKLMSLMIEYHGRLPVSATSRQPAAAPLVTASSYGANPKG